MGMPTAGSSRMTCHMGVLYCDASTAMSGASRIARMLSTATRRIPASMYARMRSARPSLGAVSDAIRSDYAVARARARRIRPLRRAGRRRRRVRRGPGE